MRHARDQRIEHAGSARLQAFQLVRQLQERAGGLRRIDDPYTLSVAWPGANPLLARAESLGQLTLPLSIPFRAAGERGEITFDATHLEVRALPQKGRNDLLDHFLGRYHYSASRGMPGPGFGLYYRRGGFEELVGVCTFGRIAYPRWARTQFRPLESDFDRARMGLMTDHALAHRLVNESEYLELNRLTLKDVEDTEAPLGRGASSWFVARCLDQLERRNRALWLATTKVEHGIELNASEYALLQEARLDSETLGSGFCKTVVSFADPWQGHIGLTYQALGFHYAGRTENGKWQTIYVGERSGESIHKRTRRKAISPAEDGHDTAVLRMIWEGGTGVVRVVADGDVLEESDGGWVREAIGQHAFDRTIQERWRAFQKRMQARYGSNVCFETEYVDGGIREEKRPPKHRYIQFLGAKYWQHELERRCIHLAARMAERDRAWLAMNSAPEVFWRGPLPDTRAFRDELGNSLYYPQAVAEEELKPSLRNNHRAA